jgi:DNA-binding transcriptional MerR regulator
MADLPSESPSFDIAEDELVAIPRLAEQVGVTPRVLRYWEEQGLISPTREHGKLRYSPRDVAIARLTKRLLDAGASVDGIRMLKDLSEREIRWGADGADEAMLSEIALRVLYQRKAFREVTGMNEEHYPDGDPKPPGHGPGRHHGPGPKEKKKKKKKGPKPSASPLL